MTKLIFRIVKNTNSGYSKKNAWILINRKHKMTENFDIADLNKINEVLS